MTVKGVSSLFRCKALEDLLLRHNVRFERLFLFILHSHLINIVVPLLHILQLEHRTPSYNTITVCLYRALGYREALFSTLLQR